MSVSTLLDPAALGQLRLTNRLAVAPMTRVSATADGLATTRMADYYGDFAAGGFGLVITEGVYTDRAYAQGYLFQPGLADDIQGEAWRPVVERVHASGGRIVAQLMHAGAISQGNRHRPISKGPSAVQPRGVQMSIYRGEGLYRLPAELSLAELDEVVGGFASSAVRAKEAGFDGVEIHGANGYLLDQFLTDYTNQRTDGYGGSLERRLRICVETILAVRQAVGSDFTIGYRVSLGKVNDFTHKWGGGEVEAAAIFQTLSAAPLDYLHTTEFEAWQSAFGEGPSLAALARHHGTVPVIANGSLHSPVQAVGMIARGEADLVSLGRGALTHANWPHRLRDGQVLEAFDRALLSPVADLANADRLRGVPHGVA
ncbi:NADH:flavin oxidoreductase [Paucibacter sp. Y2R2-4]|uniref:NADH:flavin oxidoreductase n=1 Tax=Paucibacter sp. Y2R2-4 TaxID=2893553 RepID=UPI0021E48162|nr:NADH:flavin oxidoreductase [Paucibacter sp. Y2R2-4]MCV2348318.1 NADH:flavin oxidoreductase [Paucibacter sp. Y2R2-4]